MSARTGHLERTAEEPREYGFHKVTLGRIDQVNEKIRLFRLMLGSPIEFTAGQWLDTCVPEVSKVGGFTITSPPVLASSSTPAPYLELAIQKSPENPPAAWLWRPVHEILGQALRVRVGGSFVFPPVEFSIEDVSRVVFVAGGVGINPLMSMLSFIGGRASGFQGDVKVLYSSKVPSGGVQDILFVNRIAGLLSEQRIRGCLRLFLTGPYPSEDAPHSFPGSDITIERRRFTAEDLEFACGGKEKDRCLVYVCGPPTMTDEVVQILTRTGGIGLDPRRVLTEKWW